MYIIDGNTTADALIILGATIGVLGGFSAKTEKLLEDEPLTYTDAPFTQTINRLLFVIGCVMCLFADYPRPSNDFMQQVTWIMFPFLGFVFILLSWLGAFWMIFALKAIIRWIFASFLTRT